MSSLKTTSLLVTCFAAFTWLQAQADEPNTVKINSEIIRKTITLDGDFTGIHISGYGTVRVRQDQETSLTVTTNVGYINRVVASIQVNEETEQATLNLSNLQTNDKARPILIFDLTVPNIDHLKVADDAGLLIAGLITDKLDIQATDSGQVLFGSLQVNTLNLVASDKSLVEVVQSYEVQTPTVSLTNTASFMHP